MFFFFLYIKLLSTGACANINIREIMLISIIPRLLVHIIHIFTYIYIHTGHYKGVMTGRRKGVGMTTGSEKGVG